MLWNLYPSVLENDIESHFKKKSFCSEVQEFLAVKKFHLPWLPFEFYFVLNKLCIVSNYEFLVIWFRFAMVLSIVWPRI